MEENGMRYKGELLGGLTG